jgi:hypothetical protein
MSVRPGHLEGSFDSLFGGNPSPVSGVDGSPERQGLRVGTGFTFPLITLENHVVVTDFEGDVWYRKTHASLTVYLGCPPSNREVLWWLEKCSIARAVSPILS